MTDCYSIPLSLYIHVPWCVQKCPYCDFNSHPKRSRLPEIAYVDELLAELTTKLPLIKGRTIDTIFIGGGTPSLFSPEAYAHLFSNLKKLTPIAAHAEITLEANPGSVEAARFEAYRQLGINRLSLGIQSFNDAHLKKLGRIHNKDEALKAIEVAKNAGFTNFNLDLMFGLPDQTIEQALSDLKQALAANPTHLSWYQLTLEPNTLFYKYPPPLPNDDYLWEMQAKGQAYIGKQMQQYEISAYSVNNHQCQHNLNYWRFGDYLGIGAGAHSKLTLSNGEIRRLNNIKHPKLYLTANEKTQTNTAIKQEDLLLEFMLNACRLFTPISIELLQQRTGLDFKTIQPSIKLAAQQNFLTLENNSIHITPHGHQYLNELLALFMTENPSEII